MPITDDQAEQLLNLLKSQRNKINELEARLNELEAPPEMEGIPAVPISQTPCHLCHTIHDPKAEVVSCVCYGCEQVKPLIHCGYCQECTFKALGMGIGMEFAAQAVPTVAAQLPKMPWEEL